MLVFFRTYSKEAQYILTRADITVNNTKKVLCNKTVINLHDKEEVTTVINIIVDNFDKLSDMTGKIYGVNSVQLTHLVTDEEAHVSFMNGFLHFNETDYRKHIE